MANPGMSVWAALIERAALKPGETVLVNGATGSAGRLAVQLAKYLGAGKVIATGRNESELQELLSLGADAVIPFTLGAMHPSAEKNYEQALREVFAHGVNVVVDYLWGESARTVIIAIAKTVEDATPVRFVHVGGASGEEEIALPGAALRSSAIQLMGSGVKSVPLPKLLGAIKSVFEVAGSAKLQIATQTMPLAEIEVAWEKPGKPRVVVTIEWASASATDDPAKGGSHHGLSATVDVPDIAPLDDLVLLIGNGAEALQRSGPVRVWSESLYRLDGIRRRWEQ